MNEAIRMQISAFVDGELPDSEADLLLRRLSQDAEMRREAADYLEIGRIMRGEPAVRGIERLRQHISAPGARLRIRERIAAAHRNRRRSIGCAGGDLRTANDARCR